MVVFMVDMATMAERRGLPMPNPIPLLIPLLTLMPIPTTDTADTHQAGVMDTDTDGVIVDTAMDGDTEDMDIVVDTMVDMVDMVDMADMVDTVDTVDMVDTDTTVK